MKEIDNGPSHPLNIRHQPKSALTQWFVERTAVRTILVTGGAGFVGSHACKAPARAGYSPVTFDNLERGHDWAELLRASCVRCLRQSSSAVATSREGHRSPRLLRASCARCLRRSSSAVATSREGHRSPRSGREGQHRRWGRGRSLYKYTSKCPANWRRLRAHRYT